MVATHDRRAPFNAIPWVESPFFEEELTRHSLGDEDRRLAVAYNRDGYAVIKRAIQRDRARAIISDLAPTFDSDAYVGCRQRLQDGWKFSAAVRSLAEEPQIMRVLSMLYGRRPIPFQTLNFKFGSQQRAHADAVHFSGIPGRFMCGVWVALEDVGPDNGPLFYHPGSHKLPEIMPYHLGQMADTFNYSSYEDHQESLMDATGLSAFEFHADLGDALIWSSNVVHGGRRIIRDGATRWSQVTHYFFEDCIYLTPMQSNMDLGEFMLRNNVIDISTGKHVDHSYNGRKILVTLLTNGRSRISPQ
jgi:hypothetical protein